MGRAGRLPDEGIIFRPKGPIAATTDPVIDVFVDSQEGASKELAVDRICCCNVQFDGGVRNTIVKYLGCCERVVRIREPMSRKIVGYSRQPGNFVGWDGMHICGHDEGRNSSS